MISWRATVLSGAVMGLACSNLPEICDCPSATVFGRVQTAAGAPVVNALVLGYVARAGDCGTREFADGSAETRADGTYTLRIAGPDEVQEACVLVRVRAPAQSGLLHPPDTTVTLAIRFLEPLDSTRVDATLVTP
jgi:hypothetical protein